MFQFTPVLRRATDFRQRLFVPAYVSIHARLATGDAQRDAVTRRYWFQFTPVLRRATSITISCNGVRLFQFTPVLRRATQHQCAEVTGCEFQFTPVLRRATGG